MILRITLLALCSITPTLATVTYGVVAISPQGAAMASPFGVTGSGMLVGTADAFTLFSAVERSLATATAAK